ncbi:MAG: M4 family metallopeptidase, partial [Bacteroidia bacterium]|nr:M4 family metallopeptidase [Bacteroidia bacterium]
MKKFLALVGCIVFACTITYSQNRILKSNEAKKLVPFASEIQYTNNSTCPSLIIFEDNSTISKEQFFLLTEKTFKSNRETNWKLYNEKKDALGFTHYKYQQYYQNVKVETGQYFLHERSGKIEKANGVYYSNIDVNPAPTLTYKSALTKALDYCGASIYMWQLSSEENWLKERENNPMASFYPEGELVIMAKDANFNNKDMRLCWKFDVYAHEPMSRAFYYIDAHTGELIFKNDRICTGVANGTAQTMYSGTRAITTDSTAVNNFRLRDATRGGGVETYDMNNGTSYGSAVDFTDTDNNWTTTTNDDHAANDAHWGAANTYDYYFNVLSRNSYDDAGSTIESYVHRGVDYNNAFWNGSVMTYGDGDGSTFTPLTALDVVGHEITHGVTEFSSNLIYSYESGALNESFSDIFGAAIEFYALGVANGDWIVGEDMTPSGTGIRNMMDPNIKSDPDTYLGAFWHTSSSDNGGVHTNSGVQNYWFYLLVEGGSGTNDNNDTFNITGLGVGPAAQIAYRNNNVYLTSSSQYADARSGAIQAAIDLYGPCSPEVEATTNAWYAVGVGNAYVPTVVADFESDITSACSPPYTINFSNNSSNAGTFVWDFGDGNTSTLSQPSHTYTTFGNFDVKLISDGGVCGTDSIEKVAYISIDSLNPCIALVGDPVQTGCSGVVYDPGGPGANYDDNLNLVTTISPLNAATVTLTFNSFDIEPGSGSSCNWDYVEIFDGPTTSDPSFGRFCNTTGSPGTIISTGPSLTILFYSDVAVTHAGFDATWSCTLNNAPPVSDFVASVTQSCDGVIEFTNNSVGIVDSVHWDFGDGYTSTDYNPTHTYQTSGDYSVELFVENVNGSNTNLKSNYISISRPPAPIVPDMSNCGQGAVTLSAGASTVNWYDAIVDGNLLSTGSSYVTPLLNTTTNYYAEEMYPATINTVGPLDNSFGGGAYFSNNQSLIFNSYKQST